MVQQARQIATAWWREIIATIIGGCMLSLIIWQASEIYRMGQQLRGQDVALEFISTTLANLSTTTLASTTEMGGRIRDLELAVAVLQDRQPVRQP